MPHLTMKNFKVFSKKTPIFPKKPQILNVLRNLTFAVSFYGKFSSIWFKKIPRSEQPNIVFARAQLANIG